jgi:SPP1 gp7 family putative phage head morphogenesis protein
MNPNATDTAPYQPTPDPGAPTVARPLLDQELAISQESAIANRFELLQYNPDELFMRKGVRLLEKMAISDDMISMCLASLKMMALSAGYEIKAASPSPIDESIADEVAANFENMEGSLREKLFSVMGALDLGVSFHEKIWGVWPKGSEYEGHVRLVALKAKNPQWFNMAVDDFNNITGFVMISPPAYGRKLPARKVLYYSGQKRYENNWGTARQRALYDWWYLKGIAKAAIAVLLKKYGKETPIGFVPPTMSAADKQSFLNTLVNLATTAAASVPEGTKIEWAKFDPSSVKSCLEVIEKADQQIVKVLLGQVMSSGTSAGQSTKGGSQAGGGAGGGAGKNGQLQEQTLNMYLKYICSDISENPFAELIKEIVDYNYEGVTRYPKFVFKPLNETDMSSTVAVFIAAATASIGGTPGTPDGPLDPVTGQPTVKGTPATPGTRIVTATPDDEEHIREVLGFPSLNGKTTLRPNRNKTKAVERVIPPLPPIDPAAFPVAGYRPPTPSAPGLPANYAEAPQPKARRALTKFEKGVNFSETWNILENQGAQRVAHAAAEVVKRGVEKLKAQAKSAVGDSRKIKKLSMPYRGELARVLRDGLQSVADDAVRQARAELRSKKAASLADINAGDALEPKEVLQLINDQSFTMAGNISDEVLKRIQQVMYQGVKNGDSYNDIVYKIEDAIAPYVDLSAASSDLAGARIMNAVRTNVAAAYNDSRKAVFMSDVGVVAFQFSAILDGDTTEWCAGMDGRIFKKNNPIWNEWTPPTFFQCRSVLIPITVVDGWDGEESDEPTEQPPEGFN